MISEAVICLGSNAENSSDKINMAIKKLAMLGQLTSSDIYTSEGGYRNCVCILNTSIDFTTLYKQTKLIEEELGRRPNHKNQGKVLIDLDVIYFDSELLRPADAQKKYFLDGFNSLKDVKAVEKE